MEKSPINLNDPNLSPEKALGNLVKKMEQPKQQFSDESKPPADDENDIENSEIHETSPDKKLAEKPESSEKDYSKIAKRWFKTFDIPLTSAAGFIAKEPASKLSLDEENQIWLIEQIKDLAEINDWRDPGPLPAIIAAGLFGYSGMFMEANSLRKEKKKEKEAKKAEKPEKSEKSEKSEPTISNKQSTINN